MRHARQVLDSIRDAQQRQVRWFEVLAHAADGYMRSPLFLVCMRYGLEASNRAQAITRGGFVGWRPRRRRSLPSSPHS
jgi:hypothetical protein